MSHAPCRKKEKTQSHPTPSDEGVRGLLRGKVPRLIHETRFQVHDSGEGGELVADREIVREQFRKLI